ncbi:SDR family oxidoreductase [Rhodopirellula halodulae]|uniref:SDR family oxidoreductase n=1 Tax=Rhodopirellula halodulae TaxID=2894198 RepID=UPI001E562A55|nr:SDR family oxidoreductase [Rhodopirellula sp. JC737]MCC9655188.1 SDR family oxidoreductase [Rhodopirellula sp. JC737]
MQNSLNRTAIVTGASRGIGAAIARRLANDGFHVIVNYARSEQAAQDVVSDIQSQGGQAVAIQADVSDSASVQEMFDTAESVFGGVDVLVNNAGIMKLASIEECEDESFDAQVAVNFRGTFNTLREAGKRLRDDGRIINLSTTVVGMKFEKYGIYAGIKAAVETMTAIMAKEMRGRNITVNAVAPGPTATDLFLDGKPDELVEKLSKAPPLERLATPDDIASVVSFLAGPDGSWINGQTIRANGGMV